MPDVDKIHDMIHVLYLCYQLQETRKQGKFFFLFLPSSETINNGTW